MPSVTRVQVWLICCEGAANQIVREDSQEAALSLKAVLDDEIRKIIGDPSIGQEKKGTLKGVFVHKFKIHTSLFLLACRCDSGILELIMSGSHENYYRDLDTYLKG